MPFRDPAAAKANAAKYRAARRGELAKAERERQARLKAADPAYRERQAAMRRARGPRQASERDRERARKRYLRVKDDPAFIAANRSRALAWQKANPDRVQANMQARLARNLRGRLKKALQRKSVSAVRHLGIGIPEFMRYLETKFQPGMSWENYGQWELDHVRPLATFDLTVESEALAACHYANIQPLWAWQNRSKGKRTEAVGA